MHWLSGFLIAVWFLIVPTAANATSFEKTTLTEKVELLFAPGSDLVDVKLAVDALANPATDVVAGRKAIDDLTSALQQMAVGSHTSLEKLAVLKRFVYESGSWNDYRPFAYDMADPLGENPVNRQIAKYISSRPGNCVTMPQLFMILGQRIGLDMTLSIAPLHSFVKFTDDRGRQWNLETTSGAGFTRDLWYRKNLPMTDKAVTSGIYLRALSREEIIAVMASTLVGGFLHNGHPEDAIAVSQVILRHYPGFAMVKVQMGSAYSLILNRDVISRYARLSDMPPEIRVYADGLYQQNLSAFAQAEALGWTERDGLNEGE
jgi:regulator of sirC expression with transglutaminase-like and TPR domain